MEICKKTWPEYFEAVLSGKKKFDMRVNDFKISKGDILVLQEFDPNKKEYSGREIRKEAIRVDKFNLNSFSQKEEIEKKGLQIISFE